MDMEELAYDWEPWFKGLIPMTGGPPSHDTFNRVFQLMNTAIPWGRKAADNCPDGPRYKALGNSMPVPVMHWIGERIEKVEELW